jgi:DNA topoisomerase-3
MTWHIQEDTILPEFKLNQVLPVVGSRIVEGRTEAPGYLTEANLIGRMEKNGIGTDASIATHINNIILRNYVTLRDPGRQLVPTPLGYALVKGYCEIDPELVLPKVRGNIEKCCDLVARGKVDFSRVVNHVNSIFFEKFKYFKLNVQTMEKLLAIMRIAQNPNANKDLFLSGKIPLNYESADTFVNFCIKCFQGHFCI